MNIAATLVTLLVTWHNPATKATGQSMVCRHVEASSPAAAAELTLNHGEGEAHRIIPAGARAVAVAAILDNCYWMPGDAPGRIERKVRTP